MHFIRQGTANTVITGPFVSNLTALAHNSLTIGPAAVFLSKNGALYAAKADTNTAYHNRDGFYPVPLDTTDTDTAGRLRLEVTHASCLPLWEDFTVLPAPVYDWLVAGSSTLNVGAAAYTSSLAPNAVSAGTLATGAITSAKFAAGAIDAAAVADGAIDAATFAAGAINAAAIANGAIDAATFAAGAIDATAIADNAIDAGAIADNAITAAKIADGAIDDAAFLVGGLANSVWQNPTRTLSALEVPGIANSVWNTPTRAITDKDGFNLNADQSAVTVGAVNALPAGVANTIWNNPARELTAIALPGLPASVWYYPINSTRTARDMARVNHAVIAGTSSGGGTANIRFYEPGVATAVVSATVDSDGNRSLITLAPGY